MILQASRDFSLQLLRERGNFPPFGTRAKQDGEIEFIQLAWEADSGDLSELYLKTQEALVEEVRAGSVLAVATVANIQLDPGQVEGEYDTGVRVHIEAPEFSRAVVIPYRFLATDQVKLRRDLEAGTMIPVDIPPAVYAA